jgi:hypothetical protein
LREEYGFRVIDNRVLRKTFGPKRDEVTGNWRKSHDAELRGAYSSPNIIRVIKSRRIRWAGHVERIGDRRGAYSILVGKFRMKDVT